MFVHLRQAPCRTRCDLVSSPMAPRLLYSHRRDLPASLLLPLAHMLDPPRLPVLPTETVCSKLARHQLPVLVPSDHQDKHHQAPLASQVRLVCRSAPRRQVEVQVPLHVVPPLELATRPK